MREVRVGEGGDEGDWVGVDGMGKGVGMWLRDGGNCGL